jgi:4-amino-4-deoxy-L-arabinose transferase-like glycosyltransferase
MAESPIVLPSAAPSASKRRWRPLSLPGTSEWPAATLFLVLILALYVSKQIFSVAAFYPFSGHDELAHFSYVRTVATEHRIPVLPDLFAWREGLNGGQAPPTDNLPDELYPYCRFALDWFCAPDSPRWQDNPPRIVTVPGLGYFPSGYQYAANHPPLYYAVMTPFYLLSQGLSPVGQQYVLRLAAIPFGLITVFAAYRASRALFPGDAFLVVTVPALVAFQPQISYEAAMVNNDIVAIALTSLILWGVIAGVRDRFPLRLCVAVGVTFGLALLAKGTSVTIAPVIAVALLWAVGWRDWRGLLARGLAMGVPAAILAAPWYLFLYRTYGDLSGFNRIEKLQYWNSPMGSFQEMLTDPQFVVNRFKETWGEFGWRLIHLRPMLLWMIAIPIIVAGVGLVIYALTAGRDLAIFRGDVVASPAGWQKKALVLLLLACVLAYLAVIQFGTQFVLTQARYYFPVVNAAALLTMLGLRTVIPRQARPVGQGLVVAALVALNIVIMTSYVLPFTITLNEPVMSWSWGG